MGLGASWIIQIGGGHPTCSWCPHHHLGYSRSHKQNQAFSFADSQSPWKIGPETGWTVQIRGGQIFKPLMFREYFAFYSLIRKYKKMGPPDLECPQKSAPGDIQIFHFWWHPISDKNPSQIAQYFIWPTPVHCNSHHGSISNLQLVQVLILG